MPFGDKTDRHDDVTNPKIDRRLNLKDRGEFLNDDLAPLFDLHLKLAKLLEFVELHCDAGPTVLKLKLRFKPDGVIQLVLRRNDKSFHINVGASLRVGLPIEVSVVNCTVARNAQPL